MGIKIINPATEEILEEYDLMLQEEVQEILQLSYAAYKEWQILPIAERSVYFTKLAEVLRRNNEEYAHLIAQEMGKPIRQARVEVEKCAWTAEIYAEHSADWLKDELVTADGKEHLVTFEPLGVILSVMPWNFPFWQALRFAIPTVMAGNASILKHASSVTGCALAIEQAFREAGFPENIFRTIVTDHQTVSTIIAADLIAGVSLTGSTEAGQRIGEWAGKNLKKVVLELGGSDPFIVLEDADIDFAARKAVIGRFQNCGQSCIAAKRFIVMENVAEDFISKFAEYTRQQVIGDPLDEKTDVGPLVNKKAVEEIAAQCADAVAKGASVVTGGKQPESPGFFFEPTVLEGITKDMKVFAEEVFGPIAPVLIVTSEEEALEIANESEFGLGASVWTKDLDRGKRIAKQLACGAVFVNSIVKSDPRMPFGGIKKSGIGRELSHYGLKEFVNVKAVNIYDGEKSG